MVPVLIIIILLVVFSLATVYISNIFVRNILAAPFPPKPIDKGGGEAFAERAEAAVITSRDGLKLKGWFCRQDKEEHRWIISVHGYKDRHEFMLPYGEAFYQKGYNVLLPDNRGHGESEGNYIGMGWLDKEDILCWIDWILQKDAEAKIVLHGVSMGAATVMMTSGHNQEAVKGYIEDCGYTSVWDIFACVMKRDYHLPTFPILNCSRALTRTGAGYDYKEASCMEQIKKCRRPMFFIHGDADDFIPVEMGRRLYEAFEGEKELYIAEGAGHALSMDVGPDIYFQKIFAFIESVIDN